MTPERTPVGPKAETMGAWHKVLQPHIDRFHIAATFDQDVVLNGTGCAALASLLRDVAERLDCNYPRLVALEREAGRLEGDAAGYRRGMEEAIRILGALPRHVATDLGNQGRLHIEITPTVEEAVAAIRTKMEGK